MEHVSREGSGSRGEAQQKRAIDYFKRVGDIRRTREREREKIW